MSESYMARLGARLVDNGYPVLPIMPGTKKPGQFKGGAWRDYPGWTKHGTRPTSEHELAIWNGWPDAGIGIPTGTVIGVDIDIRDDEVASLLEQLAREMLGDTPAVRFGLPPKRLLVYRAADAALRDESPSDRGARARPAVRRLRRPPGDQAPVRVAAGVAGRSAGREPAAGRRDHDARLSGSGAGAGAAGAQARPAAGRGHSACGASPLADLRGTPEAIVEALRFIPNADLDYDSWVRIGMALKGALGEKRWDLFAAWSATSSQGRARDDRQDLGEPQARAHRRRHHLPLCAGRRLDPGSGAGAERRHFGQRPASSTLPAGTADRAGRLCSAQDAATAPARARRPAHIPARRRAQARWSTTSWRAQSGRSRSSPSAPACARSAR